MLYVRTRRLTGEQLVELTAHERIVAVKYAIQDVAEAGAILSRVGTRARCVWICGAAESMVPAFSSLGFRGVTSGLANVRPDLALGIWEASKRTDWVLLTERAARILPSNSCESATGVASTSPS